MITTVDGGASDWRSLRGWLAGEEELRGRVRLVEQVPQPGTLGVASEMLQVALGPGSAAALVSILITWIRHRSHDETYEITRSDGVSVKVSANRVRGVEAAAVRELVAELARSLETVEDGRSGACQSVDTSAQ